MPLVRGRRNSPTSTATPAQNAGPELPPYEAPSHPLNQQAQRLLSTLSSTSTANSNSTTVPSKVKHHLRSAAEALGEVTDNINELATIHRQKAERRRARSKATSSAAGEEEAEEDGADEDGGAGGQETASSALSKRVDGLTSEIEEQVRGLIDLEARIEARDKAMRDLIVIAEQGGANSGSRRATQSTLGASQFRNASNEEAGSGEGGTDEGDGEADRAGSGEGNTDSVPAFPELMSKKMEGWGQDYGSRTMRERYAEHNYYIGFKDSLHSGQHAGNEHPPPVPPRSTWFRGPGGDQPSLNRYDSGPPENEGSDDDIEAVGANINIRCPITLLPMKDPVKSRKCPHHFEKGAIEDMIRQTLRNAASSRRDAENGAPAPRCPVCSTPITLADLAPDPALRRNIRRIQAAEEARRNHDENDSDDDGPRTGRIPSKQPQKITSSPYQGSMSTAPRIKAEKVRNSVVRGSVVPGTQFGEPATPLAADGSVDLDEISGDDEAEEEEEEEEDSDDE